MKTKYTIEELRGLGIDTIGDSAIIGIGPTRRELRAKDGVVTIDPAVFDGRTLLMLGAKLSELEPEQTNNPAPSKLQLPKKTTGLS